MVLVLIKLSKLCLKPLFSLNLPTKTSFVPVVDLRTVCLLPFHKVLKM